MNKTLKLDVYTLLPEIENNEDCCIHRLENTLRSKDQMDDVHLETGKESATLCLEYDPTVTTPAEVARLAQTAGHAISNRYRHERLAIQGIDCSDCTLVLEHSLGRLPGVQSVKVSYAAKKLWIDYDSQQITHHEILKRIRSLGYSIPLVGRRKWLNERREVLMSLGMGLVVLVSWGGNRLGLIPSLLSTFLYVLVYLAGGWEIGPQAWASIRERHFDTDFLMIMAAIGAAILGDFVEGALLLSLFSLGHALEEAALDKARTAIESLADLSPKTALVRSGDREVELPVEQIQLKDVVIIRPGVRIPVDGEILAGNSNVDQSTLTGEPLPVPKNQGDAVFAGTLNGRGALEVRVSRLAMDTTLACVLKATEEAQAQKSPAEQVMERFEGWYVPAVLIATVLAIVLPPLFGETWNQSFMRAMVLLVSASPCALALGAPASILAGIAQAARSGILVKGGVHLENLGRLKAIAFDKTGTITFGKPQVVSVQAFTPEQVSESQLLGIAAAIELRSGHPLAQAISEVAHQREISLPPMDQVEAVTGRGVQALSEGRLIRVGSLKYMEESHLELSDAMRRETQALDAEGNSTVLVAVDGTVIGLLGIADRLRPEVPETIAALKRLGVRDMVLLTGDHRQAAEAMARQAGIEQVYASLMPEDKLKVIQSLVKKDEIVAMLGDGVNDAPALANATLGIALGGAGTDVAMETADVVLMANDLRRLPFAIRLGRATRAILIQNIGIALAVIAVLVLSSLTGWISMGVAVVVHESSTVVVGLNSLRLLQFKR